MSNQTFALIILGIALIVTMFGEAKGAVAIYAYVIIVLGLSAMSVFAFLSN